MSGDAVQPGGLAAGAAVNVLNVTPEDLQQQMEQHISAMIQPLNAQITELKQAVTEASMKEKDHNIKMLKMELEKQEHEIVIAKMAKLLNLKLI